MKIANTSSSRVGIYTTLAAQSAELKNRQARAVAADDGKSDVVSVSRNARLMTLAKSEAQNAPDVRSEKIAALRNQLENGTYMPDSKRIAMALVREEPGLFLL